MTLNLIYFATTTNTLVCILCTGNAVPVSLDVHHSNIQHVSLIINLISLFLRKSSPDFVSEKKKKLPVFIFLQS